MRGLEMVQGADDLAGVESRVQRNLAMHFSMERTYTTWPTAGGCAYEDGTQLENGIGEHSMFNIIPKHDTHAVALGDALLAETVGQGGGL